MKNSVPRASIWRTLTAIILSACASLAAFNVWVGFQQRQSELEDARSAIAKLRSISTYGETWTAPDLSNGKKIFALGSTAPEISANLFSQIKSQAEPLGLQIISTADGEAREVDGVRWQSVSINLQGAHGAILAFLMQMETVKPYVFVDRLRLQFNMQPGVTLQQEPILTAEISFSAPTGITGNGAKP